MENLPMSLTISRVCSSNREEDIIRVSIRDETSSTNFTEIQLSLADFALCVTGLSCMKGEGSVRNLDRVGKRMEMEHISFEIPDCLYEERKEVAKKHGDKYLVDKGLSRSGWIVSDSFNSQNSFYNKDDKHYARATIRRWV